MHEKRLLVVDDDPTTRFALKTLFTRQGWRVAVAATVAGALDALRLGPAPPYLILDLNLPDGQGERVLRAVREARLPTRVLVCSGLVDGRRLAGVMALEPDALLAKPIDPGPVMQLCLGH